MSHLHRHGWAFALLLASVLTLGLASTRERPTPEGAFVIHLPAIFNGSPYGLQPGSPTYLANFLNTFGCNWLGIAGRAFGADSNPVIGLTVHLDGGLNTDVMTGSGPGAVGPGGYLIPLGDHPLATTGVYFIQLRDNVGAPLSAVFMIPTYADCNRNLIIVNFKAAP